MKLQLSSRAKTYYHAVLGDSTIVLRYHSLHSSWKECEKLKAKLLK